MTLRVLVACEMSGRVRTAFARRGWDAWSADVIADESALWAPATDYRYGPGRHHHGDALDIITEDWDLVIAHPPCNHLSGAGARYWAQKQADGRQEAAALFFTRMLTLPRPGAYVVVENPHGIMSRRRNPDQVVQPFEFGDPLVKATCLWFRPALTPAGEDHLPLLVATHTRADYPGGLARTVTGGGSWRSDTSAGRRGMNHSEDSQGRARRHILRGLTPAGFAAAAAQQWGSYIENQRAAA